ncbi:unnamed protein product [Prunus armeniaca]|uniref:Uncharacterized protein n=1 Tax=Prunus armeniaca TaxID=36596 RepID=A0A6J5XZI8_PRUAR|nr:unnamed protein product [Prunus armeniaca]
MGLAVRQGHLAEGCSLAIVNFGGAGVVQRRGPRSWNRALKSDLESLSLELGLRQGWALGAGLSVAGVLGRAVLEQIWDWDVAKVGGAGLSL